METDRGKLFIGGISWDTNEERLKDISRIMGSCGSCDHERSDHWSCPWIWICHLCRSCHRGEVLMDKHVIDGRTVEAKKAVPREDQHILNRSSITSIQGSPGPARTKKIFVGGLASTVTESDFKMYFDQFGMITDVVVMYDHNTQRPRGFGFITFDSEEAVEKYCLKPFMN
ncbi:hypothetical protein GIB67_021662 [Kingdonia uniflora]|uniref:RRM domain-containing protein n=1 Tax=Kingdonia uniflora TaxID=39325 RepID=A0A7J7P0Y0_9MAGN|nr:hypothetical protein GIB67_021662 [Kingdonia uniflora]